MIRAKMYTDPYGKTVSGELAWKLVLGTCGEFTSHWPKPEFCNAELQLLDDTNCVVWSAEAEDNDEGWTGQATLNATVICLSLRLVAGEDQVVVWQSQQSWTEAHEGTDLTVDLEYRVQ